MTKPILVLFYRRAGDAAFTMHGLHLGTEVSIAQTIAEEKWDARGDLTAMELRCTSPEGWRTEWTYDAPTGGWR